MNFVDAKNEFCTAINLETFEGIGFYTYNKKKEWFRNNKFRRNLGNI